MATTLAFDVYGTLIDAHGVVSELEGMIGDRATGFSQQWREKQLEYSFRRGLMQDYAPFDVCTCNALDYVCALYKEPLTDEQKQRLLACYRTLPAFDDVHAGLAALQKKGCRIYAFSNGTSQAVTMLLESAGIEAYFIDIISVDDVQSFKPDPAVYRHFLKRSNANKEQAWLVSSNPFDVIGAVSSGMNAAWVRRSETLPFDPWGIEPTLTVQNLTDLSLQLS